MASVEKMARDLERVRRDLHALSTQPRLGHSSIDGGALELKDIYGNTAGYIGQQFDGSVTAAPVGGPPPVAPSMPLVTPMQGGLAIYWDGTYVDGSMARMDFRRVTFHAVVNPDDFDPLDPAQIVGEVTIATGGEVFAALPPEDYFIYGTTWSEAGKFSVPSDPGFGKPKSLIDEAEWQAHEDKLTDLNTELVNLETVVIPGLAAEQDAAAATLEELNTVTIPGLQDQLDGLGSFDPTAIENRLDAAEADVTELQDVTLPALNTALTSAQGEVNTLKNTTIPNLNTALTSAQGDVNTLKNTTIPNLNTALSGTQGEVNTLKNTTIPNLNTALSGTQGEVNTLKNTTIPNLNTALSANATAIADRARVVFATAQPTGLTSSDRVIWYDTDGGYAASYWGGTSWSPYSLGGGALADGAVSAAKIADGAVGSLELAADAVTEAKLAVSAISTRTIAAGAITDTKIADSAVTASKIVDGAIGDLKLAANAVSESKLAVNAISSRVIAAGAITETKIGDDAITTPKIATGAVTASEVAANAIIAGKIAANAVTATTIAADAVVAGKIAANAVTATTVAANAIIAGKIAADAVTATTIAADAVTAGKIAANAVTAAKIEANAVVAGKIAANAVTATTIAADAVTAAKIAANAVTADKVAANAITANKLSVIMGGGNLLSNSSFESDLVGWLNFPVTTATPISTDSHGAGTKCVRLLGGSNAVFQEITGLVPGEKMVATVWVKNEGASKGRLVLNDGQNGNSVTVTSVGLNAWERLVAAYTVPSTGKVRVHAYGGTSGGTSTLVDEMQLEFGEVATSYMARADEILPGTIQAGMVAANAITANSIASDAVVAGKIAANAVTATTIASDAVVAGKIAANAVTATTIAADAVTATKVAANAIVAGKIAADAVTATTIAADAVTATKVAANAIVAGKIAANAVTATTIAADAVTATKIEANAVVAGKIAANAVTATTIAADAVTATKVAANAIVAGKIAANAVTATTIATDAVVAGKIAADAVTATTIAANAVTARSVAARAITTEAMAIADFTDYHPDPYATDKSLWRFLGASTAASWDQVTTATPPPTGTTGTMRLVAAGTPHYIWAGPIPVTPGDTFFLTANIRRISQGSGSAGVGALGMWYYDKTGAYLSNETHQVGISETPSGAWVPLARNTVIPPNAATARAMFYVGGNVENFWDITDFHVRRRYGGELIVDGSISVDKIASNAVSTDKLAANAVTADKVAANGITAKQIAIGDWTNLHSDRYFNILPTTTRFFGGDHAVRTDLPPPTGGNSVLLTGRDHIADANVSPIFECANGDEFFASVVYRYALGNVTDDPIRVGLYQRTATNSSISANTPWYGGQAITVVPFSETATDEDLGGGWFRRSWKIKAASKTLAPDLAKASIWVQIDQTAGTARVLIGDLVFRRRVAGSLIVDGSILANHIGSNTITANEIDADAITVNELKTDAITSKHTITGAIFRTQNVDNRGVRIAGSVLTAYNGSGVDNVVINGNVGTLTVKGANSSITGALIRTSASGERMELATDDSSTIKFFSGAASETLPSTIYADDVHYDITNRPTLVLTGGRRSGHTGLLPQVRMSSTENGSQVGIDAESVSLDVSRPTSTSGVTAEAYLSLGSGNNAGTISMRAYKSNASNWAGITLNDTGVIAVEGSLGGGMTGTSELYLNSSFTGPTSSQTFTPGAGWTTTSVARRFGKVVTVEVSVTATANQVANAVAASVVVGYRPGGTIYFVGIDNATGAQVLLYITNAGQIKHVFARNSGQITNGAVTYVMP